MEKKFDFEKALEAIQSGKAMTGKDGVLAPLIKQLTEAALEAEIDSHLAEDVFPNRKNGKSRKTIGRSAQVKEGLILRHHEIGQERLSLRSLRNIRRVFRMRSKERFCRCTVGD